MAISSIYILDMKGKKLIYRDFRGNVDNTMIEKFYNLISNMELEGSLTPIINYNDVSYIYIKHKNIYIVAITKGNQNAIMILSFLIKFKMILSEYFDIVEEESIRDNFVLIYELLDEIVDYGFPQITESKVLKSYIIQSSQRLETIRPPPAVTNAVSWRGEGITYRRNDVYVDVMEKINLLVSAHGNILRNEVFGEIKLNVQLSGMPELRLGFNDRVLFESTGRQRDKGVELEDVKFHQCVRLASFESERTISFIPPDGKFELMSYRIGNTSKPPFMVESIIDKSKGKRIEYIVKVKSHFKRRFTASNVEIRIPVPEDASSPVFSVLQGTCKYRPEKNYICWSLKSFPGLQEYVLRAAVSLPSIAEDDSDVIKSHIRMSFEIQYFTLSGLNIRYLKIVEKSGYHALPWVRYVCNQGDYEFRIS